MENILRKKLPLNIDPKAKFLIDILSISNNAKILGSQQYQSQLYAGDYDLYEVVNGKYNSKEKAGEAYAKKLQRIIHVLLNERDVFIGDIKCGGTVNDPIRWKPKDILKGSKDGVSLKEAILQPALCKVDIVAWIAGRYVEMSIIYEFKNKNEVLNPTKVDVKQSILESAEELKREGEYFKALKRKFSIAVLEKKPGTLERLTEILNSDLGRLYLIISDLKTLLYLFENNEQVPHHKLEYELEQIRVRMGYLSTLPAVNNPTILKKIEKLETASERTIQKELNSLIKTLSLKLNRSAKPLL